MISVVVATYGDRRWRKTAERAISSALGQGVELVVVHDDRGNLADVRNAGARKATQPWLCFLDGDDEFAPGFLDAMNAACEKHEDVLLVPAISFVLRRRKRLPAHFPSDQPFRDGNALPIATVMPTSRFLDVGGFREWGLFEDWDLWARLDLPVVRVPDAVYLAHVRLNSRNRVNGVEARNYWHQKIGHDLWPDYYEPTTADEDAILRVLSVRKR